MRIKYSIFLVVLLLFPFLSNNVPQASADNTKIDVTLSDAVNADLALKGYLDNISLSYTDGKSVNNIAINETTHWLPASTVKLFTAMYAYKQITDHKLNLYDTVPAEAKNVVTTELVTDELPTIQEGEVITIDRLLRQMITQSDNTAFNMLLDVLDRQKITQYIHDLGLTHSAIGSKLNLDTSQEQYEFATGEYGINTTTAEDYTNAFLLIKNNKISGAKDLFEVLKQQKINNMLPLLLPKTVVVAHKTGDLDPLYHDGGIIVDPDNKITYVVSIFSNLGDPNYIAHLSNLIYTKNYDLVGANEIQNKSSPASPNPSIDPLVANATTSSRILGANTTNVIPPSITAADLGITAKDLSLAVTMKTLPQVIIPSDSFFHFLIPTWQFVKKTASLTPQAKIQIDLDSLTLQIAEAKDQKEKGNAQLANSILQNMQHTMVGIAKDKSIVSDPIAQTTIQSVSETRFSLLGDELKNAKKTQRLTLIKEIAKQAKSMLKEVQPNIPEASNATNPSQKPLVGEIVQSSNTNITIKTPGGQEVTVPIMSAAIKIRDKELPSVTLPLIMPEITTEPSISPSEPSPMSSFQVGTTVALFGSSNGKVFAPSFILTNLPRQLVAPHPVSVVKVNPKNNTIVVSENGIPLQVNVTKETIIKGQDTNVSIKTIKTGDIIVVHGEPVVASLPNKQSEISMTQTPVPTPSISLIKSGISTNSTPTAPIVTSAGKNQSAFPLPAVIHSDEKPPTTSSPNTSSSNSTTLPSPAPAKSIQNVQPSSSGQEQNTQPKVIQSTSIQVIEKAQDVKKVEQSQIPKPSAQSQPAQSHIEQPKPQSNDSVKQSTNTGPPKTQTQPTSQQSTTQKNDTKGDSKN